MAIRNIVLDGDEILEKVCRPVEKFDEKFAILLDDMAETMYNADGVGLAAPQVGLLRRAVVIDTGDGDLLELINPVIMEQSGEQECLEGCLSFPGEYGITKRPLHIKVHAQDRNGVEFEFEADELKADVCCHEIDHLDGINFKKRTIRMLDEKELEKLK